MPFSKIFSKMLIALIQPGCTSPVVVRSRSCTLKRRTLKRRTPDRSTLESETGKFWLIGSAQGLTFRREKAAVSEVERKMLLLNMVWPP